MLHYSRPILITVITNHNVFASFDFQNNVSLIKQPRPRNLSLREARFQSRLARILFTSIMRPLRGPNLHDKVFTQTIPASPRLARCVLGKVQASLLVIWQKRTLTFFKSLYVRQTWLGHEKAEDSNVSVRISPNISFGNLSIYEIFSLRVASRGSRARLWWKHWQFRSW